MERDEKFIDLMRRLLPNETDIYVRKGTPSQVIIPCEDEKSRKAVGTAHELTLAESHYNVGFDLFAISPKLIKRHPQAIKRLTNGAKLLGTINPQ